MSLRWKLFLSYLLVVGLALLVLAVATAFVAPVTFADHLDMMGMRQNRGQNGSPGGPGMMMGAAIEDINAELNASFRQSLAGALLLAGAAAGLAAVGVNWLLSRRIVRPLAALSTASQHIAAGHYDERLPDASNDELGELTRSFNRMAAALAETEAMRQQLLADVSHELKTPLAAIQGYMEGLQDGIVPPETETYQRVQHEAARLQRLVHDLQELSRAEAAQLDLHPVSQDGSALAVAAADWLRPQFADQDITLAVVLPPEPLTILADFDRTRQVLLNLLGNALQYTPAGGHVRLSLARDDDGTAARFTVQDDGIGLAGDDLTRVFQRFYRVDKSRARVVGGSGIGLTIARHIVEAQGGRIWAASDGPGQGSTFAFTLPLA